MASPSNPDDDAMVIPSSAIDDGAEADALRATGATPRAARSPANWGRLRLLGALLVFPNFITLIVLLIVWQFTSKVWLPRIDPHMAVLMPAPSTIAVTAAGMIASGELLFHLMASLKREAVAFLFAASAIPLGIMMGWWRLVHDQVNPLMEILRPIPPLA